MFRRIRSAGEMLTELKTLFAPQPTRRSARYFHRSEFWLQGIAVVLALMVVVATTLVAGTVLRVRTVPIEVTNLSPGLVILDQSAVSAQIQLRGHAWALDAIEGAPLAARADVGSRSQGVHDVALGVPRLLRHGIRVDAITPERITFRLRSVEKP